MLSLSALAAPFVAILLVAVLSHAGLLAPLSARLGLVAAAGLGAGLLAQSLGLPLLGPEALREVARLGLAVLAFLAAQQCRVSRLERISPAGTRLALLAMPASIALSGAAVFALLPGMGPWSAFLIGALFPLGVGAFEERHPLAAPIDDATKRAVRIDNAYGLVLGLPLALLVELASIPIGIGTPLTETPLFTAFAGAAVGGTIGLLAGRRVPAAPDGLPLSPLIVLGAVYLSCRLLGFDAVMACIACGLLFGEEARLGGPARSRLYAAGSRWCGPGAYFLLGLALGPLLFEAALLVWLAGLVPLLLVRPVTRSAALSGKAVRKEDRSFLTWFGGLPGIGAALFAVSLAGSPSEAAQATALAVAAIGVLAGLVLARISAEPLTMRLVRATARARKKRYDLAA